MNLEESKRLIEELMKTIGNLEKQNIALEMEVKGRRKIIQKQKKDTNLLNEYEEAIIDDSIRKFEKGKHIAEKVITSLKFDSALKLLFCLVECRSPNVINP